MKAALKMVAANLVSIACVASAVALATRGVGGWGWFLLIAVLCVHSFSGPSGS
jgi:hypothetical protein